MASRLGPASLGVASLAVWAEAGSAVDEPHSTMIGYEFAVKNLGKPPMASESGLSPTKVARNMAKSSALMHHKLKDVALVGSDCYLPRVGTFEGIIRAISLPLTALLLDGNWLWLSLVWQGNER